MADRPALESYYDRKQPGYQPSPGADNAHARIPPLVGSGKRVLDVGCGEGHLGAAIRAAGNHVTGLELSPAAASAARARLDRVELGSADRPDLPFAPASFDVIVLADVLEHLFDPGTALGRLLALLAPGGTVVVSLPNVAHFTVRWGLLRGRFDYTDIGILDRGHLRFFTRASAERLLADAGLVILRRDRTLSVPFASPRLRRLLDLLRRLPTGWKARLETLIAVQLVFVAGRAGEHPPDAPP